MTRWEHIEATTKAVLPLGWEFGEMTHYWPLGARRNEWYVYTHSPDRYCEFGIPDSLPRGDIVGLINEICSIHMSAGNERRR